MILGAGLIAVGCATQLEQIRPDAEDFNVALAKCRMQVAAALPQQQQPITTNPAQAQANLGFTMQQAVTRKQFMDDCMLTMGWGPVDK